tara:strand:+ start:4378 stop:4818 length:441 start_codon:yes stop_codon:yes gene_type:complete
MSIIQTAKDLLRKGIALNDEELIEMANSLLTEQEDSETPDQPVREEVVARDSSVERASADDFVVKREQAQQRKVPVNGMGSGKNTFVDDGTEHTDIETPNFVPTERRQAPKKVKQLCETCSKTFEVPEVHRREWFVCDKCLENRRR